MARLRALLALLLLATAPASVWADDGAIRGVGGTIAPMREHPSIRMVSERVVIDLTPDKADVDCVFRFKNEGPATKVRMGFPESSSGTDVDPQHPVGFTRFETWVDGRRVSTRIKGLKGGEQHWDRWRTKSVSFAAGQTRLVRVRYSSPTGGTSDGSRSFSYRLDTGASWKGPIGRAEVLVRLSGLSRGHRLHARPAGARREGNTLSWRWDDLEPASVRPPTAGKPPQAGELVSGIGVSFYPGYSDIVLDEQYLSTYELHRSPLLEGSQLWVSLSGLSQWLRGRVVESHGRELAEEPYRAGTLLAHSHTLRVRAGSRRAMLDGKLIRLQSAPRMRQGHLFVPANELIGLLGGSSWFDQAHGRTYLFTATTRPHDPYAIHEPPKWVLREKADLRRAERAADPSQSWREDPALVVRAGAYLPRELKGSDVVQRAELGRAGKPAIKLIGSEMRAEFTVIERTERTARVQVAWGPEIMEAKEVYLLARPFGRWWYITGMAGPQEALP